MWSGWASCGRGRHDDEEEADKNERVYRILTRAVDSEIAGYAEQLIKTFLEQCDIYYKTQAIDHS